MLMDQKKIGNYIREIRTKNNLTQQEFASSLGVTYQAVSKWETGKNIPDIEILKTICQKYNKNIDELLNGEDNKNKKSKRNIILIIILGVLLILLITTIIIVKSHNDNFEFETLTTSCESFNITGSIAYNDKKSTIYISNVNYCGELDDTDYISIECILYEATETSDIKIDSNTYNDGDTIKLEDYLKTLQFYISDYTKNCKKYTEMNFFLQINATDEHNNITSYKVPLEFKKSCDE
jgi:transcriptional regulator with XRE-family HTH domain